MHSDLVFFRTLFGFLLLYVYMSLNGHHRGSFMSRFARFASGFVLATAAVSAGAQNLLSNADFSADLSQWTIRTTGAATVTYVSDSGSPEQGAVHLTASNGETAQLKQCVALTATTLDLTAREYIAESVSVQSAGADVTIYDQPACAGNIVGFFAFNPTPVTGYFEGSVASGWNQISALHENISPFVPASALVSVFVVAAGGGSLDYYFDNVRFGPSGTLPVRLQAFDVE